MTLRHYQYLFYSVLSFALSAYGFIGMLEMKKNQPQIPITSFGVLFFIFGVYFLVRFMKTSFKR